MQRQLLPLIVCALVLPSTSSFAGDKGKKDDPPAAKTVDTSITLPIGRPVFCQRKVTVNLKIGPTELTSEEETEFIDEMLVLENGKEHSVRTFIKAFTSTNGYVEDPPLNGVGLTYRLEKKQISVESDGDRMFPQTVTDALLRQFYSVGLYLELPQKATIGETYEVDFSDIAPILLTGEADIETATSRMKLAAYDVEIGLATFEGEATLREKGKVHGKELETSYQLKTSLKALGDRIVSLTMRGEMRLKKPVHATGTYAVRLKTEIGDAVKKALKRKPKIRRNTRVLLDLGLTLSLPSTYARISDAVQKSSFQRTVKAKTGVTVISPRLVKGGGVTPRAFYDAVEAQTKKTNKEVTASRVSSPLGAGRTLALRQKDEDNDFMIRAEYYPLGRNFVMYQLVAEPKAFKSALRDFAKARKTLAKMKK